MASKPVKSKYQEWNDNDYGRAVRLWGIEFQLDMLIEECAEVIKAVNKLKRSGCRGKTGIGDFLKIKALIAELVDVRILSEQVLQYFCMEASEKWEDEFKRLYDNKKNRLKNRLDVQEGKGG